MKKLSIGLIVSVLAVLVIAQSKFPNKIIAPSLAVTNMVGSGDHVAAAPDGTLLRTNIAGGSGSTQMVAAAIGTLTLTNGLTVSNLNVSTLVVSNGFPAFGSDGWVQYANNGTNKAEAALHYDDGDDTLTVTSILTTNINVLGSTPAAGKILAATSGSGAATWTYPYGSGQTSVAYVATNGSDATAVVGIPWLPFLTVSNAIKAVRTAGGTVKIGPGRFLSPPAPLLISRLDASAGTNLLIIRGSGKPYPQGTNYLTLDAQNATVLEGNLGINRPRVYVENLGVDCGSNVCATLYGGTATGALEFYTYGQEFYTTNTINFDCAIRNVSALCKDTNSATHAILFENVLNGVVEDIDTWNGTHGFVIKGYRVSGNRIRAAGHISNGVIIKANDYAIPGYLPRNLPDFNGGNPDGVGVGLITLNNIMISHLRLTNDTAGLRIDGTPDAGNVAFIQVNGLVCNRCTYDVLLNGGSATSIIGTRIDATSFTAPVIQKSGNLSAVYVNNAVQ